MEKKRPHTCPSRFLHSWVCAWCWAMADRACFSRLAISRWWSWTRLSFSVLCCWSRCVLSCSCCSFSSIIWLDNKEWDFISSTSLSSWQLAHLSAKKKGGGDERKKKLVLASLRNKPETIFASLLPHRSNYLHPLLLLLLINSQLV